MYEPLEFLKVDSSLNLESVMTELAERTVSDEVKSRKYRGNINFETRIISEEPNGLRFSILASNNSKSVNTRFIVFVSETQAISHSLNILKNSMESNSGSIVSLGWGNNDGR